MGGFYVADCFQVPELAHLLDVVTGDGRLADILATHLGEDFHLLERSEIYIGRHSGWVCGTTMNSCKCNEKGLTNAESNHTNHHHHHHHH